MAKPEPGDGTQQGAVEMEYFFTPGFMAFRKLLTACGVDDWTVSVPVCVCVSACKCVYCLFVCGVIERECVVKVKLSACVREKEKRKRDKIPEKERKSKKK